QQIFDESKENIITELTREARKAAGRRSIFMIAENERQDSRLARSPRKGGYGVDAMWNDDFHHTAMVAATGRAEAYYSDYGGTPQEFISSLRWGFLYQGQYYAWQEKPRGVASLDLPAEAFVNFLQNHDQVANSASGERLYQQTSP